ncbi:MAG: two-component regulator propeller domain-containing protein, partial [Deltaproteobacteria bacterium]
KISKKRLGGAIVTLAIGVTGFVAFSFWQAARTLRQENAQVARENRVQVEVMPLPTGAFSKFEWINSPAVFSQATSFHDHLFIAGPEGLMEYDARGNLQKEFAVGRELPSSPLVAMARGTLADSAGQELIIATSTQGLLAFNGRGFRRVYPKDADARAITTLLPVDSGHLLLGTKKRGVLLYDGKQMTAFHSTLTDRYVTSLAGTESDLWIGTLNSGVLRWHGGETESFSEEEGLPDRQVQSIAVYGNRTFVGTVSGVAEFDRGRFSRVLAPGIFATALLPRDGTLFVGSDDQGVIVIPLEEQRFHSASRGASELEEVRQIFDSEDKVYALTRSGLYRMGTRGFGWQKVLQSSGATLYDRNISALAADRQGRLWIGYFDRGLDLLDAGRGPATHVENDRVFCVNRILPNEKTGPVDGATANGLVRFDPAGNEEQVLTRADGLISDHVTDVVPYENGLALATPAGLTFLDAGGARSMYAFHGLVNNHVYALGVAGDELLAGTLGGLSQLEKGDVQVNYTTASSGLRHNWITAVARVGSDWMVGTYGAGILGLDSEGRFHPFETATGQFEVNPNAMLVTERYVLTGTLGNGLYVYDRASGRWSTIRTGLPSLNVTAFAANGDDLYIGTDNGLVRIKEENLLQ